MAQNHKNKLLRTGSTVAAAVAMSSVISMQANAVEFDHIRHVDPEVAKAAFNAFANIVSRAIEPVETNQAIADSNKETVAENTETAEKNEQVVQDNNTAANTNETNTDGALENPDLDLPDAPEAPNTDGMGAEDYNDAVGDYNEDVDDYNDAMEDYNQGVDDYNDAAADYDQQAQEKYEEDKAAYEEAKEKFQAAMEDFKEAVKDYTEKNTAYQDYLDKLKDYTEVKYPNYEKAYEEWLAAKGEHESSEELYQQYLKDQAAYEKELADYNAGYEAEKNAVADYNAQEQERYDAAYAEWLAAKGEHESSEELYQQYLKDQAAYEKELADYNADYEAEKKDVADYNAQEQERYDAAYAEWLAAKGEHESSEELYQKYLEEKAAYDAKYEEDKAAVDAYNEQKKEEYETAMGIYETEDALYQDYLDDLKEFNEVTYPQWVEDHADWATADQLYRKYLAAKEAYDKQYAQDKAAVDARNEAATAEYERLHALWEAAKAENATAKENYTLEKSIYDLIVDYNLDIKLKNEDITAKNDALDKDLHANVAESLGDLTDKNDGVVPENGVMDSLGVYDVLMAEKKALDEEAAALAADERRDDGLGSDTYASYIEDVEEHNDKVTAHNAKVDLYNNAVTLYNQAVDKYNESREGEASAGSSTDSGTADWGNINIDSKTTFGHIDVKYTAAVAKDKEIVTDENGNKTEQYKDSATSYTVTGVYKDKATAEAQADEDEPSYSLTYVNTTGGETKTQGLQKETSEFRATGGKGGGKASLDPDDGSISFYMTLEDENGESHGISVSLDETSVYPAGTYFNGTDNGQIENYVDSKGDPLTKVTIGKETYYDISGQSVFVISALTCNGARMDEEDKDTINTDGLDLVLNVDTLIELHKADNAEKLSYMDYELGMTAQTEAPTDPGDFTDQEPTLELEDLKYDPPTPVDPPADEPQEPEAPTPVDPPVKPELEQKDYPDYEPPEEVSDPGDFELEEPQLNLKEDPDYNPPVGPEEVPDPGDFELEEPQLNLKEDPEYNPPVGPEEVPDPGKFELDEPQKPTPPDPVEDPGDAPVEPDPFDQDEPAEPEPTLRLDHVDPLEKLDEKIIVEVVPEETPDVDEPVEKDEPVTVPDEEVPLAKAPKTGDVSGLWAILSALSAGGLGFLNRKRKEEE